MSITSHLYCGDCGAANPLHAHFCRVCGTTLQADQSALEVSGKVPVVSAANDRVLKQRYRILARIGSGGFGEVYQAADIQFADRLVAVKEMSQQGLNAQEIAEATEAFKREAFLLAGLTHPNLPSIYDYFTENGQWYLVMSFIEGETLEDYLERSKRGHLSVEKVLNIGIQLASVLSYLHTRHPPVIFRDLKPTNVMRTPEGLLYLIDFGIARHFKQGQAKDTLVLGSPGYAAPEQYGRAQTTPQTDVYGLGALLHHLLTGDDPSSRPFSHAPLHLPDCPELGHLILCMLDKDAKKRPASMANIKRELQRMAHGKSRVLVARSLPDMQYRAPHRPPPHPPQPQFPQPPAGQRQMQQMLRPQHAQARPPQQVSRRTLVLGLGALAAVGTVASCSLISFIQRARIANQNAQAIIAQPTAYGKSSLSPGIPPDMLSPGALTSLSWSPDGQSVASADTINGLRIWDVASQTVVASFMNSASLAIAGVAWSPDGRRIATATYHSTVLLWDVASQSVIATYGNHHAAVLAIAWSPDGAYIASADYAHTVQVWDATQLRTITSYTQHQQPVTAIAWSPDSHSIASGSADMTVRVWQAMTGQGITAYSLHTDAVRAVAWSPNGRFIASASDDHTVQVWNSSNGRRVFTYQGHHDNVWGVAWSPDGQRIASASLDTTVQIWDAMTGAHVFTYTGHNYSVVSVIWSSDGKRIASGDVSGVLKIWFPPA